VIPRGLGRAKQLVGLLFGVVARWNLSARDDDQEEMKQSVEVQELALGERGNLSRRLVLVGPRWRKLDLCMHGQQLKWGCQECSRYFATYEKPKPPQPPKPWRGD
jgi:hypothetical protein